MDEQYFEHLIKRTILSTEIEKVVYENKKPTKEESNKKVKIEKNKEGQWAWKE